MMSVQENGGFQGGTHPRTMPGQAGTRIALRGNSTSLESAGCTEMHERLPRGPASRWMTTTPFQDSPPRLPAGGRPLALCFPGRPTSARTLAFTNRLCGGRRLSGPAPQYRGFPGGRPRGPGDRTRLRSGRRDGGRRARPGVLASVPSSSSSAASLSCCRGRP